MLSTQTSRRQMLWYVFLSLVIIYFIGSIFPISALQSKELDDNPGKCPYYITLQSILANSTLLASDKANIKLIQTRLVQFERDINRSGSVSSVISAYKNNYYQTLSHYGVNTINTVSNENLILAIARNTDTMVDNYYLDTNINCINPLYTWHTWHTIRNNTDKNSRRILQYNLASLYDQIPNRYMRIVGASLDEFQLGVFSGFFVNNQTTSLNIQLMTGMPMLTALYVLPGCEFANMGTYQAAVPWNSFYSKYFIDPLLRKIINISGIDVFTLETSDPGLDKIPGVTKVPSSLNKVFVLAEELHSYINTESYGMAYLANNILYVNPKEVKQPEKEIKHDFADGGVDIWKFVRATTELYGKLNQLKEKHDIILEASPPVESSHDVMVKPAGSVTINGIVGERAMFTTNCLREDCTFVFNTAKAPGWHVFVNGKSAKVERANFAFMATTVPNGHAIVWFIYQSWASFVSYLLSMFCLISVFFRVKAVGDD